MIPRTLKLVGLAIGGLGVLAAARGVALASKCNAGEAKAAGLKAACKLGVLASAARTAATPDPGRLALCDSKFFATFTKAQGAGDCYSRVDAATMENVVDHFVDGVNTSVAVSPPSRCQSMKLKAAGKKAKCRLGVQASGYANGTPDPVKHAACGEKMRATFSRADRGTDCGTTVGDYGAIEQGVDDFENDVVGWIEALPPPSTTTTVTTTSSTT